MFQTSHLVVVAGPSAVGKTTLLNKVRQGTVPHLCDKLSIKLPSSYFYLDAWALPKVREPYVDRLVLHYDFVHQYSPKAGFRYLSELIDGSGRVNVISLCTSSSILHQRIISRLTDLRVNKPGDIQRLRQLQMKSEFYRNLFKLRGAYEAWSVFIDKSDVDNHMIIATEDITDSPALPYDMNEVEKLLRGVL